jgi:hypothetical protein
MLDTQYGRRLRSKILENDKRYIQNLNDIHGEQSGYLHGGLLGPQSCPNCGHHLNKHLSGGKNKFNSFMNAVKSIGNYIKPVAKPLIDKGLSKALGAMDNPEMFAAGIKHHHYTTKKGDKDHHIQHHDVEEKVKSYSKSKRMHGGSAISKLLMSEGRKLAKPVLKTVMSHYMDRGFNHLLGDNDGLSGGYAPVASRDIQGGKVKRKRGGTKTSAWIEHVKAFAKQHQMKYGDAMSNAECKASYHK